MADATFCQSSFLGGEWSPLIQGRIESELYATALKRCYNSYVPEEGAWTRRPGFRYVSQTKASIEAQLIPFEYSTEQAYVIEAGALYMRFFMDRAPVTETAVGVDSISGTTPPVVTTTSAHGRTTGDHVMFENLVGGHILRNRQFLATVLTTTTLSIEDPLSGDIDGATIEDFISADIAAVHEIVTPFGDTAALKWCQDENTMLLFHAEEQTQILTRAAAADTFSIADADFLDGPYMDDNATATTLTPSGTSGSVTVTASSIVGINDGTGFKTTDIGRLIRIQDAAENWTWGEITARASTTSITLLIRGAALSSTAARTTWRLGLYSDTTGWPTCGAFHENRLWLAGPIANRLDGSKNGQHYNFEPTAADGTIADDNAVAAVFDAKDVNAIFWIATDERGLLAGTQAGEWLVRASALDDPITPTSIQARRVSDYGCADIQPVRASKRLIFVQREKRKLREMGAGTESESFEAMNLSFTGKHLTKTGVQEIVYQGEPVPVIWGRRGDGALVGITYKREGGQLVAAWHWHEVGSNDDGSEIEALAVIPSPDGLSRDLWAVVARENETLYTPTVEPSEYINFLTTLKDPMFTDINGRAQDSVRWLWRDKDEGFVYVYGRNTAGTDLDSMSKYDLDGTLLASALIGYTGAAAYDFNTVYYQCPIVAGDYVIVMKQVGFYSFFTALDKTTLAYVQHSSTSAGILKTISGFSMGMAVNGDGSIVFACGTQPLGGSPGGSFGAWHVPSNSVGWAQCRDLAASQEPSAKPSCCTWGLANDKLYVCTELGHLHRYTCYYDAIDDVIYIGREATFEPRTIGSGLGIIAATYVPADDEIILWYEDKEVRRWDCATDTLTVFSATITHSASIEDAFSFTPEFVSDRIQATDEPVFASVSNSADDYIHLFNAVSGEEIDPLHIQLWPSMTDTHVHESITYDPVGRTIWVARGQNNGFGILTYDATDLVESGEQDVSNTVRFIEYLTELFDDEAAQEDAFHVDAGAKPSDDANAFTYDGGTYRATFYGLHHLEGETVSVMVGGHHLDDVTVEGGVAEVTIPSGLAFDVNAPPACILGHSFSSEGQLLRPEVPTRTGPALGKKRRVTNYMALVHRSGPMEFGIDFTHMRPASFQTARGALLGANALMSGIHEDTLESDINYDNEIAWRVTTPVPATVLAITGLVKTEDK